MTAKYPKWRKYQRRMFYKRHKNKNWIPPGYTRKYQIADIVFVITIISLFVYFYFI